MRYLNDFTDPMHVNFNVNNFDIIPQLTFLDELRNVSVVYSIFHKSRKTCNRKCVLLEIPNLQLRNLECITSE